MEATWETATLGELCEIYQPKTISRKEMHPDAEYPVFGANGIIGRYHKFNHEDRELLVTCRGATCGSVNISLPKSWITGNAMVVRPDRQRVDVTFLEYALRGAIDLSTAITGSAQPQITRQSLSPITFFYPASLAEQKRIVAILDAAFEAIATATARTEQNLANAREVFEVYRTNVLEEIDNGWKPTTLGQETKQLYGFAFKSAGYSKNGSGVRLLRGDNIVQGTLRWDDAKFWPQREHEQYRRFELAENDVVLAMDRPWVSAGLKLASITSDDLPCLQVQRTARLRAGDALHWKYLYYLMGSRAFIGHILGEQTGLGVPHISGRRIQSFSFRRPPLPVQEVIASQLDACAYETQRLESLYRRKLELLAELKQSLLAKAFRGELTTAADDVEPTIDRERPARKAG